MKKRKWKRVELKLTPSMIRTLQHALSICRSDYEYYESDPHYPQHKVNMQKEIDRVENAIYKALNKAGI